MNLQELKRLVGKRESDGLEFKWTTGQRTDAAKTVCAMLNGLGGFVVFGVGDKGELVGQEIGQRTIEDVTNELSRIEPPAVPEFETVAFMPGRSFIVLRVSGSGGLYNFDGRYYLRVGPTTRPMPRHEYERRLVECLHGTRRWENEPVPKNVTIADLDADEIRLALENAISLGRLNAPKNRGIKSILQGFELLQDGQLLNAAVALFGKSQRLHGLYPQMGIRLGRFRGVRRLADFTDNRQSAVLGQCVRSAAARRGFSSRSCCDCRECGGRQDAARRRPAYPPHATREALANAICHRDYIVPGAAAPSVSESEQDFDISHCERP